MQLPVLTPWHHKYIIRMFLTDHCCSSKLWGSRTLRILRKKINSKKKQLFKGLRTFPSAPQPPIYRPRFQTIPSSAFRTSHNHKNPCHATCCNSTFPLRALTWVELSFLRLVFLLVSERSLLGYLRNTLSMHFCSQQYSCRRETTLRPGLECILRDRLSVPA